MASTSSTNTANTTSGSIKWSGMTSGIDFKSVVEAMVASEQRVITRQQTWQSQWQEKLTAINNLDVKLSGLKADVRGYDTREELLARKATSSKESVATITNTSTAATGVYEVEVGENVVEKIGSSTYERAAGIGTSFLRDKYGYYYGENGQIIGTDQFTDSNLAAVVADLTKKTGVFWNGSAFEDDQGNIVAEWNSGSQKIHLPSAGTDLIELVPMHNGLNSEFVVISDGRTIGSATADTDPTVAYKPLVIEMGGKKLTFECDKYNTLQSSPGVWLQPDFDDNILLYHPDMTMDDLADLINRTVADDPSIAPKIKAEVIFDKTRPSGEHSRLVITGLEGGLRNHITISDPTDLKLDRNSIDAPVTNSMLGCGFSPEVTMDSNYTGSVNKTINVMISNTKGGGILGSNDVEFSWADTEGKSGKFIVKSSDWDLSTNSLKEPIEILQGVKITLKGNTSDPTQNRAVITELFTIDCQTPVMQKAADVGLAQTDKWVHQGVADQTSPVTFGQAGKLAVMYAGEEYTFTIPDGLGLKGMVDKINEDPKNPGIVASVLNDGMGTATSYKLVLNGKREGAENTIQILDTTRLNRMDTSPGTWEHAREASNSMCRIDGYPSDGSSWIQRSGNEVGDALDGVILNLEGTGKSTITIQNDPAEMMNRIKLMVESVNFCKSYIKEQTKFTGSKLVSKVLKDGTFVRENTSGQDALGNSSKEPSGVMIGNYGFQISQSTIDRLMTKPIFTREEFILAKDPLKQLEYNYPIKVEDEERDGPSQEGLYKAYLEQNGLIYTRLKDIGIESNPEMAGQYVINESELREAITKNPEAVVKLFTFTPDELEITNDPVFTDEDPRPRIGGFAVMMGYAMNDLTRTEDDLDRDGNLIKPGKGITKVLADNYAKIISGIDEKIERETRRIEMVRKRLEDKFTRLEVLLSSLNDQQKSLDSQLAQLSGNN